MYRLQKVISLAIVHYIVLTTTIEFSMQAH